MNSQHDPQRLCFMCLDRRVFPGEGTHSDFAPRGDKQKRLLDFVEKELGYCEIEHVGCGAGLERIYKVREWGVAVGSEGHPACLGCCFTVWIVPLGNVYMVLRSLQSHNWGPTRNCARFARLQFLAAEAGVGGGDLDAKQISAKAGEGDAMAVEAMDMLLAIVGAEVGRLGRKGV